MNPQPKIYIAGHRGMVRSASFSPCGSKIKGWRPHLNLAT
jgi:hypothetical protein